MSCSWCDFTECSAYLNSLILWCVLLTCSSRSNSACHSGACLRSFYTYITTLLLNRICSHIPQPVVHNAVFVSHKISASARAPLQWNDLHQTWSQHNAVRITAVVRHMWYIVMQRLSVSIDICWSYEHIRLLDVKVMISDTSMRSWTANEYTATLPPVHRRTAAPQSNTSADESQWSLYKAYTIQWHNDMIWYVLMSRRYVCFGESGADTVLPKSAKSLCSHCGYWNKIIVDGCHHTWASERNNEQTESNAASEM